MTGHEADGLLESAKGFLVEALSNHERGKNSFAILHGVIAAELVLKARLARVHQTLIRKNIDAKDLGREQTVGLRDLPQRLMNLGLALAANEAEMIGRFAAWRNEIVHHLPSYEERLARSQVPALLNFIAEYFDRELDTPLRSFLPRELYRVANDELEKWKRIVAGAVERAQGDGHPLEDTCPDCGARGVLSVREGRQVYCHLCESTNYRFDRCSQCGRQTAVTFSDYDEGNYCKECVEAAGDAWTSMQDEIRRGK